METQKARKLLAVVFTDIEGFSALTQRNEAKALEFVTRYRECIKEQTELFHGQVVHFYGDGSLTTHESTYDAVRCAVAIQEELRQDPSIPVRIGIHFGEVVITDETIYGNAVNIAARLHNLGSPQSVLISGTVSRELQNHDDFRTVYIAKQSVKNIKEPVDIYAVKKDGLVIPTRHDLNARSKVRQKKINIASTLLGILLIALVVYFNWPVNSKERRVLVYPFTNATGDTSLNYLSSTYAAYVTQLLSDFEEVKLVYAPEAIAEDKLEFGFIDYPRLRNRFQARNIIEGEYTYNSDSTLLLSCGLIDGDNKEYLTQFSPQVIDPDNYTFGLVELTERIIGFIKSEEHNFASAPNRDAFEAYQEAKRLWANKDGESEQFLLKAIDYDSTFTDAYFLLADVYHNDAQPSRADSMLDVIKDRFRLETMSDFGKNHVYYFEALYSGNNSAALGYLLKGLEKDPNELFANTEFSKVALYYANAPELCMQVLNDIKWKHLDFNNTWNASRITVGIEAYSRLGKYKKAQKLIQYFPSNMIGSYEQKQLIRVFCALGDTNSVDKILREVELSRDTVEYRKILFWTYQQFQVLGEEELAEYYGARAYEFMVQSEYKGAAKISMEYDRQNVAEGLELALTSHQHFPGYRPYIMLVAQGFIHTGKQDSVDHYVNKLLALKDSDAYRGRTSYLEACLYTQKGDIEAALIKLQSAVNEGFEFKDYSCQFDPRLMPLFDNPEFDKIIHPYRK